MTKQSCLICAHTDALTLFSYDQPDVYERKVGICRDGYYRAWVRCSNCGFHYSRYNRDPKILDQIYVSGYRNKDTHWRQNSTEEIFQKVISLPPEDSESHARCVWAKGIISDLIASDIVRWSTGPWQMIDIGGATGVFAYTFKGENWLTYIVDPAPEGAFIEKFGVTYIKSIYRPGLVNKPVHLASMIYSLEHMGDPRSALVAVRKDLCDDGLLLVEVPDAHAFARKPADDDIFNSCHLWLFDPANLVRLLSETGFSVQALRLSRTLRGHFSLLTMAKVK